MKIFLVYETQSCSTLIVGNKICKGRDLVELIYFFLSDNYKEISCIFHEELALFSCYHVSYMLFLKYVLLLKGSN